MEIIGYRFEVPACRFAVDRLWSKRIPSCKYRISKPATLTRIIHKFSTAAAPSSALAALRSVGLLDVLHEYDCGGLGRKPCQDGSVTASLRKLMNYPG